MDRREAIKTAAAMAFVSGANPYVLTPPSMTRQQIERLRSEWEKLHCGPREQTLICSEEFYHDVMPLTAKRTKWRIVDQMIEEQGGEV